MSEEDRVALSDAAQRRKSLFVPGGENDIVVTESGGKWEVLGVQYDSKSDALDAADSEMHRRYVEFNPHGDIVVKMNRGGIVAQEGAAIVENEGPGVEAIVGEAGPEAVIPLDDPAAVEVMAEAIEEGGADTEANANDATIAAAEAVEAAAEAVEVVAVAGAVEEVAETQAEAVEEVAEAQAEAVEEVAESRAEVAEEAVEAVADVAEEEIDERPKPVHGFFR